MRIIYLDYDDVYYCENKVLQNVGIVPVLFRHKSDFWAGETKEICISAGSFLLESRYVSRFREFLWDIDEVLYTIRHHAPTGYFYFEVM